MGVQYSFNLRYGVKIAGVKIAGVKVAFPKGSYWRYFMAIYSLSPTPVLTV